jgi:hypothetical protein
MTDPLAADRLARLPGPTPFLVLDLDRVATAYADAEPPPLARFADTIRPASPRTCRTGRQPSPSSRAGRSWPRPGSWSPR